MTTKLDKGDYVATVQQFQFSEYERETESTHRHQAQTCINRDDLLWEV